MSRLVVYGDIHGCRNALVKLRKKIKPKKKDIEICVGDIIKKGKDSIGVLDYLQKHDIESVLGNHEEKIVKYLLHKKVGKKNPIYLNKEEKEIVKNLSKKNIKYLLNMPYFIKIKHIVVVHGGLQNHLSLNRLSKLEKSKIIKMRFLDINNHLKTYDKENKNSIYWSKLYNGNQGFVVYGHQWAKEIRADKHSLGIDTGCVYGNKLTAVVFKDFRKKSYKVFQVKCKH